MSREVGTRVKQLFDDGKCYEGAVVEAANQPPTSREERLTEAGSLENALKLWNDAYLCASKVASIQGVKMAPNPVPFIRSLLTSNTNKGETQLPTARVRGVCLLHFPAEESGGGGLECLLVGTVIPPPLPRVAGPGNGPIKV